MPTPFNPCCALAKPPIFVAKIRQQQKKHLIFLFQKFWESSRPNCQMAQKMRVTSVSAVGKILLLKKGTVPHVNVDISQWDASLKSGPRIQEKMDRRHCHSQFPKSYENWNFKTFFKLSSTVCSFEWAKPSKWQTAVCSTEKLIILCFSFLVRTSKN